MPGPLQAAGAVSEPSEYAPLTMDRYLTGLWTQRSLLRDANVPYLYTKFYSASRFDSLVDGLNREMTSKLTIGRRCGLSVYNSNSFPAVQSFYDFKAVNPNATQTIRVMADTASAVYDATVGSDSVVVNKSAGAGKTRFLGINSNLYMGDGIDEQQWMYPQLWTASTNIKPGTLIRNSPVSPSNIHMALGGITMSIVATAVVGTTAFIYIDPQNVPDQFPNLQSANVAFSGLTTSGTWLNGLTLQIQKIVSTTLGIFTVNTSQPAYAETPDTGSSTTGNGTTGASSPSFNTTQFGITPDAGQQWKCYGTGVKNWGITAPTMVPKLQPQNGTRFWAPNTTLSAFYAIIDKNGNIEVAMNFTGTAGAGVYRTGISYPNFPVYNPAGNNNAPQQTIDGSIVWWNAGPELTWIANTAYFNGISVLLDSNQNLQLCTNGGGSGSHSGSTQPTWATGIGNTTSDNVLTWTCLGPGVIIATADVQYGFSGHSIDGSVSTSSPAALIQGGILGEKPQFNSSSYLLTIVGTIIANDSQYDQIWIWRTAQGGSTLILEDQIPMDGIYNPPNQFNTFSYGELGIPDTSSNGSASLDALIPAPIADKNDPPPAGATAPVLWRQRVWVIVGNTVYHSGGPNTITGNGYTAFASLDNFQFPELLTKLIPVTLPNGGLLVQGTANLYVILGNGTTSNPFYPDIYMDSVGVISYDEIVKVGSTIYAFTNNSKFISLDPSAGYIECGFPIGDQFLNVTTGNANGFGTTGVLYTPGNTYMAWNERTDGDSGIYVSDGAVGWFRYSPVASPESGYLWSPRAQINNGTSAIQNVEVTTGNNRLLVGPKVAGPILMRDNSVFTDNGVPYADCYITLGNIMLCESGEVAEVAHIALKSIRIGNRANIKVLFGEIAATTNVPFETYTWTIQDPPDLPQSETLFNDRYSMSDNHGICPKCDHIQVMIQWPVQTVQDELLMHAVYGAKWAERKQQ